MDRQTPVTHPSWHEARFLDALELRDLQPLPAKFYSSGSWEGTPFARLVEHLTPGLFGDMGLALRLLTRSRRATSVALVEQQRAVLWFLLLRSLLRTKGKVILFGCYLKPSRGARSRLLRRAYAAASVCVTWSREMAERYSKELRLPSDHFVVIPYKSNHSSAPIEKIPQMGEYIFSGGDSERDYRTLFRAVKGIEAPVIVSTSCPGALRDAGVPPNVILIHAEEPHYRRLMAASRLVIVPLTGNRLRGAGEATFLNAMWHYRPVICSDDVSAPEYIANGVDGIVVPPQDPAALRAAVLDIWSKREMAAAMGQAGHAKVATSFSHDLFCERMVKLGFVLSRDGGLPAARSSG